MFDINNWLGFRNLINLVIAGWNDFWAMDLSQIQYSDVRLALIVCAVIGVLVIFKTLIVMFGRNKYARADSGLLFYKNNLGRKGLIPKAIVVGPALLLVVPFVAYLFAVANPFLVIPGEEKKYVEARTIVYLRDISGSMANNMPGTTIPKAKFAMDSHLSFLEMRFGKGDRTSFWLFTDFGFLVNNFIIDDKDKPQYLMAYDAAWGVGSNTSGSDRPEFPLSRLLDVPGGGTSLGLVLRGVVLQFDRDEEVQKKSPNYRPNRGRSVIIYSDSDIFDIDATKEQINELVKRNIAIYVIIIDDRSEEQLPNYPYEQNPFLLYVHNVGGKFFIAGDDNSMALAQREIDSLEKVNIQIESKTTRTYFFDRFVFVSMLLLIVIIPIGLLTELFFRDYP